MNFNITKGKGFYYGFDNGWGVSVQFGPGNYADNYDMRIGYEDIDAGERGSNVAECAVITPKGELYAHDSFDGDTVGGYLKPKQVLDLLIWTESQDSEGITHHEAETNN